MGSILIEAFLTSNALAQEQVNIYNRTAAKAEKLKARFPGLKLLASSAEVARLSDVIFICVKPLEYEPVIEAIQNELKPSQLFITITTPITIEQLEGVVPCKVAKVIPSITNWVHSGATLVVFGKRCSQSDKDQINQLLKFISQPMPAEDRFARVSSDLTSCSPAFLSFILQSLTETAAKETGIPIELAKSYVRVMLQGLTALLTEGGYTFGTLQERVSVPGGVTQKGLSVLAEEMEGVFARLFQTTHAKHRTDLEHVEAMFNRLTAEI
jgi:competence protein ComER